MCSHIYLIWKDKQICLPYLKLSHEGQIFFGQTGRHLLPITAKMNRWWYFFLGLQFCLPCLRLSSLPCFQSFWSYLYFIFMTTPTPFVYVDDGLYSCKTKDKKKKNRCKISDYKLLLLASFQPPWIRLKHKLLSTQKWIPLHYLWRLVTISAAHATCWIF